MIDRASFPAPSSGAHCEFGSQPDTDVPFLGPHVLWFYAPLSCSSHLRGGEGRDMTLRIHTVTVLCTARTLS